MKKYNFLLHLQQKHSTISIVNIKTRAKGVSSPTMPAKKKATKKSSAKKSVKKTTKKVAKKKTAKKAKKR